MKRLGDIGLTKLITLIKTEIKRLDTALNSKSDSSHTHSNYIRNDITSEQTIKGNLRLKGSGNYGNKLNFGDSDYVHFYEYEDDKLEIKASTLKLTPSLANILIGTKTLESIINEINSGTSVFEFNKVYNFDTESDNPQEHLTTTHEFKFNFNGQNITLMERHHNISSVMGDYGWSAWIPVISIGLFQKNGSDLDGHEYTYVYCGIKICSNDSVVGIFDKDLNKIKLS